jgi:hypothetical protein
MTLVLKTTTGNSVLDNLYDTLFGASPVAEIRTGAPAGPDNAAGGSLIVGITAPATAFSAAAAKSKAKTGTWSAAATLAGTNTAGHFRFRNAGDTVREEGTVTATGGGGDMTVDNTSIAQNQVVTITQYTRTI